MIVCLFRNRLPNCSDDLSHWSDIFTWRQLHYKHMVKAYEGSTQVHHIHVAQIAGMHTHINTHTLTHAHTLTHTHTHTHTQSTQAMLIVHHSASAIIQYARVARKHKLYPVCLDSLSKIHSIPSVPVLDCFQKIRQQVQRD